MPSIVLHEPLKKELLSFLKEERSPELIAAYLFYLEKAHKISPTLFLRDKLIYKSSNDAVKALEDEGKLWRETEIKIGYGPPSVNEETKKIYICPFTGKVFGDNTHPNPQDAIYEWVSKCPENTERVGGVKAKRFFVSEDPEVIKSYIKPSKTTRSKIVYSSVITGKLFHAKASVVEDFIDNYLKPMSLIEAYSQNKFKLEEKFQAWLDGEIQEEKLLQFVEKLSEQQAFQTYVKEWVETEE